MNAIEHAVALPPDEVVVHRATRRKILRNIAPLTTGAQDVHQAVHHRTHVGAALAAARPRRRNERRNNRPLLVREVAWVPQMITIVSRLVFLRPHRQPHESDCLLSITNDSSDSRSFKTDTKQILAFRGQLYTSADAIEQRHTEFRFKGVNLARRCRLAQVKPSHGPMDAASFCYRNKGTEVAKVHLG